MAENKINDYGLDQLRSLRIEEMLSNNLETDLISDDS